VAITKHEYLAFGIDDGLPFFWNHFDFLVTSENRPIVLAALCYPIDILHGWQPSEGLMNLHLYSYPFQEIAD
jgi:hypothetical protein